MESLSCLDCKSSYREMESTLGDDYFYIRCRLLDGLGISTGINPDYANYCKLFEKKNGLRDTSIPERHRNTKGDNNVGD